MQSVEKGKKNLVDLESSGSKITCRWITTSFNMTWQFFFLLPLSCWEHTLRIGSVGVEIRSPTTGLFPPWPKSDQIESINIINPAACVSCPHQHVLSPVSTAFLLAGQRWSRGHSHWFSCGLCKCVWNGFNCKLCPSLFFFFPLNVFRIALRRFLGTTPQQRGGELARTWADGCWAGWRCWWEFWSALSSSRNIETAAASSPRRTPTRQKHVYKKPSLLVHWETFGISNM